jgi:hypothetical protein
MCLYSEKSQFQVESVDKIQSAKFSGYTFNINIMNRITIILRLYDRAQIYDFICVLYE